MANKSEKNSVNSVLETYYHYRDAWQDARETTEECLNFVLGEQWKPEHIEKLKKRNLPYLTKNLILPIFTRIAGTERQNKTEPRFVPAEDGLEDVAAALNKMHAYFANRNTGDASLHYKLSQMFELAVIGDLGAYIRPVYTTEYDPLGEIRYHVIPGLNVLLDPRGRSYDLSDHKRIIYTTWWTKEEAKNRYPERAGEIDRLQPYRPGLFGFISRKAGKMVDLAEEDKIESEGRYRVIEMWERRQRRKTFYYDPFTGEKLTPQNEKEVNRILFYRPDAIPMTVIDTQMWVTITIGDSILLYDGPGPVQNGMYPFIPFFPYYLNGNIIGIVHNLRDYQKEENIRSSQILHILNSVANSGWMAKKNSISNIEYLEEEGAANGVIIYYQGEKPEKIQPTQVPNILPYLIQENKAGIYETSGIGPNLMGRAEGDRESGALFSRRVEEGATMMQVIFDNYALTKELLGKYELWIFQNKFTFERTFTIINEEGKPERFTINQRTAEGIVNDITVGKYNVIVENAMRIASAKQNQQYLLAQLAKFMPPELLDWSSLIRATDLPTDLKEKMAKYAEQKMGIAPNEQAGQPLTAEALLNINQQ